MTTGNDRKRALLGMPIGTATARLRKNLLFCLSAKLGMDVCHRCALKIERIDEFSIEHKKAWARQENPVEAFFDLENIAFSHLNCNISAASKPHKKYATVRDQKRGCWERYYAKNGQRFLEMKRDRYNGRR